MSNCLLVLSLFAIFGITDACRTSRPRSSITTPRPRPGFQRFETYKCPPDYAAWYCLNNATCFAVKMGAEVLYNCECRDSFIGPRCDYKYVDIAIANNNHSRIMLACVTRGALVAFVIIVGFLILLKTQLRKTSWKLKRKSLIVAAN